MFITTCLCAIWRCFSYEEEGVTAWMKTAVSRAPTTVVVALFSASALLFIAGEIKDCNEDNVDLGFISIQVSSVLAGTSVIENVINLFLAPFLGAFADAASDRKVLLIGANIISTTSFGVAGLILFATPSLTILWIFILLLVFTSVFFELSVLLVFAYLPEIIEDTVFMTNIVSRQYAIVNAAQLGVAVVLGGFSLFAESLFETPLPISAIAHFSVVAWFLYFGVPGLYWIPRRKSTKTEKGAVKKAFNQIIVTGKAVFTTYPQVGWFLGSWTFFFSGLASVTVLQVAYTADEFGFETPDIAVLGVLLLIFAVVGAVLCEVLAKYLRLKTILMTTLIIWTVGTFIAPWVLRGEDDLDGFNASADLELDDNGCPLEPILRRPTPFAGFMVYIVSIVFGLLIGFIYPTNTAIYALIIPGGEEATYFGFKTFCAKVLAWAPAALFFFLNEAVNDLQLAFMSLGIWFLLAIPFMWKLDVDKGIEDVKHTLGKRQGAGAKLYGDEDGDEKDEKRLSIKEIKEEESKVLEAVNPVSIVADALEGDEHKEDKTEVKVIRFDEVDKDNESDKETDLSQSI